MHFSSHYLVQLLVRSFAAIPSENCSLDHPNRLHSKSLPFDFFSVHTGAQLLYVNYLRACYNFHFHIELLSIAQLDEILFLRFVSIGSKLE